MEIAFAAVEVLGNSIELYISIKKKTHHKLLSSFIVKRGEGITKAERLMW